MDGDTLSGLDLGSTIRGFAAGQVLFERYKLERILGRGGMGVVWLAHDQQLNEDIALKFLPEAVRLDALALEDLKRETRKSRKLTHQNIVRVYNFLSDAHCAGISMEWIDGSTLSSLRMARPLLVFEPDELKSCVRQVCEALEYAHGVVKLIHRDLKPANIMLSAAGEAKITDFGISSTITESASRVSVQNTSSGTLAYMSPQQALGERPTPADDIYSLGATLYELIAGKPPFFRGDLYMQIRDVVPPPMAERRSESEIPADAIPAQWEEAVAACLAKDPAQRPQSAMEVAWRLGLVKDYDRKAPAEIPKPGIVRVPIEEPRSAPPETVRPTPAAPLNLRRYPVQLAAGAFVVILLAAVMIWHFSRPHPAPIAKNATPKPTAAPTVAPVSIVRPAPTIAAAPSVAPAPIVKASPSVAPAPIATPTAMPAPSAIAFVSSPSPSPGVQPMSASPAPSVTGTEAAAGIDKQLVGLWQTGTTQSKRKRLDVQSSGKYVLTVAGAVADTGTMSGTNGDIQQFSKNAAQPAEVNYEFDDGNLVTHGDGPFDEATWHRVAAASHQPAKRSGSGSSGSHGESGSGIGSKLKSAFHHIF